MKVDEFVAEMKRDWRREGRVHKECMRCQFWENIEQAIAIIESQRAALTEIAARGPRKLKTREVMAEIACRELEREV
jgi:hypothetical protein